jgi:hypothetical protein
MILKDSTDRTDYFRNEMPVESFMYRWKLQYSIEYEKWTRIWMIPHLKVIYNIQKIEELQWATIIRIYNLHNAITLRYPIFVGVKLNNVISFNYSSRFKREEWDFARDVTPGGAICLGEDEIEKLELAHLIQGLRTVRNSLRIFLAEYGVSLVDSTRFNVSIEEAYNHHVDAERDFRTIGELERREMRRYRPTIDLVPASQLKNKGDGRVELVNWDRPVKHLMEIFAAAHNQYKHM